MSMQHPDIVITGAGLITALGQTREEVWQAVCAGRCGIAPMDAMEQPLPPGKNGGQAVELRPLSTLSQYPGRGVGEGSSETCDPSQTEPSPRPSPSVLGEGVELPREVRYLRRAILDALAEAGIDSSLSGFDPSRCAFMLGTTLHGMRAGGQFLRSGDFSHLQKFLAGQTLDLATAGIPFRGIAATTCSACSSSLGSIALAVTLLESGQYDLVVAGGYDTISEYVYGGFNSLRLVAENALRPFSEGRQGMKLAEGYGIIVLERSAHASKRQAKPLARVAGWGESADAHHLTQPHPKGEGAARAMQQAITRAGLTSADIDFVSAHATGTPDNDAAEHAALAATFGERLPQIPVVGFKSHLGHTLGGAGAVELVLSMMALREQIVPPCANVTEADLEFPDLNLAHTGPTAARIDATLNTSLGFGGANTSVVLTRPREAASIEFAPELREVFITGIGAVLPGIFSNDALVARMNHSEIPAWQQNWGSISDSDLEGLLNARRVRRMSEYVKLQLAAATLAIRDAGILDVPVFAADCSAILGTMHGSAGYSLTYYEQIVKEGIFAANPMLFAEGVPNGGAAQLSLMLGIKGACQTIIGTRTAGLDALNLAAARIATGAWDRAIIGAGEEKCEIIEKAYQHCGLARRAEGRGQRSEGEEVGFVYSGGSVAMVLESADSIAKRSGNPAKAKITGWAAGKSDRAHVPASIARMLSQLGSGDAIISSANSTWIDRAELLGIRQAGSSVSPISFYRTFPELFSASSLLGIAAMLLGRTERVFASLSTDFSGAAACTRVERIS